MPMFHRARYLAATELELGLQPPIYLRHAVLALGACASPKYAGLQERFYRSSREALEFVEMNDHHLDMVSVEQAQTWILIATYGKFRELESVSGAVALRTSFERNTSRNIIDEADY